MRKLFLTAALASAAALAQLPPPNDDGVAMGHLHIRAADTAPHEKFWSTLLETQPRKRENLMVYRYPGGYLLLQAMASSGGSAGSVLEHVGFSVKSLNRALARLKDAGFEAPAAKGPQAFVVAPGEVRVELSEDPSLAAAVASHHIHWYNQSVEETKAWYVKTFGAKGGKRGRFEAADLPGVNLTFSAATQPVAKTKGRVLDHIGFEVRNLERFCRQLEGRGIKFDVPYRKMPQLGIALAFLTDPWGTNIELTEGLREW
jgi:catechol 2,3-dioxygenase-like lactoylglutathione lyase family enzyme